MPDVSSLLTFLTSHQREDLNMIGSGSSMTPVANASQSSGQVVGATLSDPARVNESQNA